MLIKITKVLSLSLFFSATTLYANENDYMVIYEKKTKATVIDFKSEKGDVYFNHDTHLLIMENDSCLPCHKTTSPTKKNTITQLGQRKAHYFCKGCHKNNGRGPTECHECHKQKQP
jgi:thioredoxin-related protein